MFSNFLDVKVNFFWKFILGFQNEMVRTFIQAKYRQIVHWWEITKIYSFDCNFTSYQFLKTDLQEF